MTIATNCKINYDVYSRKVKKVRIEILRKVIDRLKKIELSSPHEIRTNYIDKKNVFVEATKKLVYLFYIDLILP